MMKMKAVLLTSVVLFVGSLAQASSLECTSRDSRLTYSKDSPDGGPERPPIENLKLDGKVLIATTWPGGNDVVLADFAIEKEISSSPGQQVGRFMVTKSMDLVKVVLKKNGAVAYEGRANCTESIYNGEPIP